MSKKKPVKNSRTYREAKVRAILFGADRHNGSGGEFGPFSVGDAGLVMDAIDPQASVDGRTHLEREREWHAAWKSRLAGELLGEDSDLVPAFDRERARGYRMILAMLRSLRDRAVRAVVAEKGISGSPTRGWLAEGCRQDIVGGGETNYVCLFCDADLASLGARRVIPRAWITEKVTRHCDPCAMRWLVRRVAEERAKIAKEQAGALERSTEGGAP